MLNETLYRMSDAPKEGLGKVSTIIEAEQKKKEEYNYDIIFVNEVKTLYYYQPFGYSYPIDNLKVLSTGDGCDTRWVAISGAYMYPDDWHITGDLNIEGTLTKVHSEEVLFKSNVLFLNWGETGHGVTKIISGIEVDRGKDFNYQFIYDENTQTFRVGLINNTEAVAAREDNPLDRYTFYWDGINKRFNTHDNFKFDVDKGFLSFGGERNRLFSIQPLSGEAVFEINRNSDLNKGKIKFTNDITTEWEIEDDSHFKVLNNEEKEILDINKGVGINENPNAVFDVGEDKFDTILLSNDDSIFTDKTIEYETYGTIEIDTGYDYNYIYSGKNVRFDFTEYEFFPINFPLNPGGYKKIYYWNSASWIEIIKNEGEEIDLTALTWTLKVINGINLYWIRVVLYDPAI